MIYAPFSNVTIDTGNVTNTQTFSPSVIYFIFFNFTFFFFFLLSQSTVYINAEAIALINFYFYNNNFDYATQSYQGGFLSIESNNLVA